MTAALLDLVEKALRSRFWYRQFREIVLLSALTNLKKLAKTL